MPKVSFIVPIYNSMPYLTVCLDSLRNQTCTDIEIICVNDCSPDNSLEYLNNVASMDKRIKIINHTTNKRQGGAWNSGVEIATGDYLSFIDADDWVDLDYCERLIDNEDADIICALNYYTGNTHAININADLLSKLNNDIRMYILLYGMSFITNFIKRTFLKSVGFKFIENNMYQDFMTDILYFKTNNIKTYVKAGYHYRIDNISIQRSINQNGFWGRLEVAKLVFNELQIINNNNNKYKDAIEYHFYLLYYRNTLVRAFYGYSSINWPIVSNVIKDTNIILPHFKTNKYYNDRFYGYSLFMKLPIYLFENLPKPIVNILHKLYITTQNLRKKASYIKKKFYS